MSGFGVRGHITVTSNVTVQRDRGRPRPRGGGGGPPDGGRNLAVGVTQRDTHLRRNIARCGNAQCLEQNDQWRITFRIVDSRALDVTIEDYH